MLSALYQHAEASGALTGRCEGFGAFAHDVVALFRVIHYTLDGRSTSAPSRSMQGRGLHSGRRVTGNAGSIPEREPEKRLPLPRRAAGAQITQLPVGRGSDRTYSFSGQLVRQLIESYP